MGSLLQHADRVFDSWYASLRRNADSFPARGTIGGALVVLGSLREEFNLDIEAHTAESGTQIALLSGSRVSAALAEFGEHRLWLREGGRTNRGAKEAVASLLDGMAELQLDNVDARPREETLVHLQKRLVGKVDEWHSRQRLRVHYDPAKSTAEFIKLILNVARTQGKEGQVAEYVIGAKLQLRFPNQIVRNSSYSTADEQLGERGDFQVGDTIFHVSVAPNSGHFDKCDDNLRDGFRVYFLVPEHELFGTMNLRPNLSGRVSVESIESFVSQNLEELAGFDSGNRALRIKELLTLYNERVNDIETDKSLLIEIPGNI